MVSISLKFRDERIEGDVDMAGRNREAQEMKEEFPSSRKTATCLVVTFYFVIIGQNTFPP